MVPDWREKKVWKHVKFPKLARFSTQTGKSLRKRQDGRDLPSHLCPQPPVLTMIGPPRPHGR